MSQIEKVFCFTNKTKLDVYNICDDQLPKLLDAFEAKDGQITKADYEQAFLCKSRGFTISGSFKVFDDKVSVRVKLPWAALPFKSVVETAIEKRIGNKINEAVADR